METKIKWLVDTKMSGGWCISEENGAETPIGRGWWAAPTVPKTEQDKGWSVTLKVYNYKASVTLCVSHSVVSDSGDPMDCSPSGSSVHGILQARILEWVAIPFSREQWLCWGSFQSHGGVKPAVDRERNWGDGNGGKRLLMQSRQAPAGMTGRWASFKCWPCHVTLLSHSQHWKEAHLCFLYLTGSFPVGSDSKESVCSAGDPGLIPGLGRSPREGNGNPPQNSCLENPMGRGAWWTTVHGVARVRHDCRTRTLSYKAGSHPWPQKSGEAERTQGTVWMRREASGSLERQKQLQKVLHLHPSSEHFGWVTYLHVPNTPPSPTLIHQPWERKGYNSRAKPCRLNSVLTVFLFFIQVSVCVSFLQLLELGQSRHDFQ